MQVIATPYDTEYEYLSKRLPGSEQIRDLKNFEYFLGNNFPRLAIINILLPHEADKKRGTSGFRNIGLRAARICQEKQIPFYITCHEIEYPTMARAAFLGALGYINLSNSKLDSILERVNVLEPVWTNYQNKAISGNLGKTTVHGTKLNNLERKVYACTLLGLNYDEMAKILKTNRNSVKSASRAIVRRLGIRPASFALSDSGGLLGA